MEQLQRFIAIAYKHTTENRQQNYNELPQMTINDYE